MGCSCGPEIYEQKNISCGEKAKPNFPKLLRYSLSLDRHFSIAVFKAYLKVCPKNWSPEKKLILEQEKLQSSDLKMLTASENTVIKTAVLQATASKGTSCLGEQSLPSGENKSRATSNTVSLPVFPWNDSHEARSHWDTASSAGPQRVTRAWPGQWAGAVVWRGGRDQAPNKKTSFRRPHSYGSPNRPPRPTTPHRAHNASRCSPAGWRSAEEPVRRPWWGRGDGGGGPDSARTRVPSRLPAVPRAPPIYVGSRHEPRGGDSEPALDWVARRGEPADSVRVSVRIWSGKPRPAQGRGACLTCSQSTGTVRRDLLRVDRTTDTPRVRVGSVGIVPTGADTDVCGQLPHVYT